MSFNGVPCGLHQRQCGYAAMRSDRDFTAWVAEAKKKYAGNEE